MNNLQKSQVIYNTNNQHGVCVCISVELPHDWQCSAGSLPPVTSEPADGVVRAERNASWPQVLQPSLSWEHSEHEQRGRHDL